MLFKRFRQLLKCTIAGNRSNGRSGHHSLANQSIGKLEDSMDQAALFRTKVSTIARNVDELTQLGFCIARSVFWRWLEADESDRAVTSPVESSYGPLKHA